MRKRTSTNKTKGSGYQIHFILNDEDYKLLIDNINIRGINQSDYFRELIHGTNLLNSVELTGQLGWADREFTLSDHL